MSTEVKPLLFSDLPKLSKADADINNLFITHLNLFDSSTAAQQDVQKTIATLIRTDASLSFENFTQGNSEFYLNLIKTAACIAIVVLPPQNGFAFIDVSPELARTLIYRVLGAENLPPKSADPLSEVELGVFAFILIKVLNAIQPHIKNEHVGQCQLLETVTGADGLSHYLTTQFTVALLTFRLSLGPTSFFVRLALSSDLLQSVALSLKKDSISDANDLELALKRSFAVTVPIIAELGHVSLKLDDFHALDVDDIIVLEDASAHLRDPGLVGDLRCKIGDSEYGSFKGGLFLTKSGRYALQVKELVTAHEPVAEPIEIKKVDGT